VYDLLPFRRTPKSPVQQCQWNRAVILAATAALLEARKPSSRLVVLTPVPVPEQSHEPNPARDSVYFDTDLCHGIIADIAQSTGHITSEHHQSQTQTRDGQKPHAPSPQYAPPPLPPLTPNRQVSFSDRESDVTRGEHKAPPAILRKGILSSRRDHSES
jgi:hypothetical protein